MLRLTTFDDDGTALGQLPAAFDRFVGTLNGFHGDDHAVFDDDALPECRGGRSLRDVPSMANVFPLFFCRFPAGQRPLFRENPFKAEGRPLYRDAFPFELRELRKMSSSFHRANRVASAKVRKSDAVVNTGLNAAEHDGMMHAVFLKA